jgi:hypothetical protein
MRYRRIALVLLGLVCLSAWPVWAQTENDKYIDLMRKDLRKEKQSIVDQSMGLDAAKKAQFWAIYADYQTALDTIWDQRIANIKKYAGKRIRSMQDRCCFRTQNIRLMIVRHLQQAAVGFDRSVLCRGHRKAWENMGAGFRQDR